jgi:long-chain fatty acid transport protein
MRMRASFVATVVLASVVGVPAVGRAAGFMLFEQSARGLGSAFGGEAAAAEDASTIYYNPAGLGWIAGTQVVGAGFAIMPSATFENHGSTLNAALGGGRLRGGEGGDAGELGLVPTIFVAHELGDGFHVGLGVSVPFGLETRYERGWIGRYHALSSRLETTNVNPTIAYRPTEWLAIGVGADIEYAKARLTNAIDLGGVCEIFGTRAGLPPGACTALGFAPQSLDGVVKISGDDWGAGFNAGVMVAPWSTTRIGLAYRSNIEHELRGRATFFLPKKADLLRRASGALVDTGGSAEVDLPERVSLAAFHEIDRHWAILADVTWTRWSRFDELVFQFANPKQPTIVQPEGWRDSFRYALSVRYTASRAVELRLGAAYDESAIPDASLRTPRIPDADRVWIAAGVAWRPTSLVRVDVGYAHIFSPQTSIDNRDPVTGHVIRGDYSAEANIVGVQMTYALGWPLLGEPVE